MFEVSLGAGGLTSGRARRRAFQHHRQEIFRSTDRLFARLMLFQWLAGILIALFVAPPNVEGQSSQVHIHVWAAIFLGGAISIFPHLDHSNVAGCHDDPSTSLPSRRC